MKYFILAAFIMLSAKITVAQNKKTNSGIIMVSDYGSENSELNDVLQFQNIDYYRVKFIGSNLREKYFSIICKEIWDGFVKKN